MGEYETHPLGIRPKGSPKLAYKEKLVSLRQKSDELCTIIRQQEDTKRRQGTASHQLDNNSPKQAMLAECALMTNLILFPRRKCFIDALARTGSANKKKVTGEKIRQVKPKSDESEIEREQSRMEIL